MEGTSFNEFFLPSKLENNLNDNVDVLSDPHTLVKMSYSSYTVCMYFPEYKNSSPKRISEDFGYVNL